MSSIHQDGMSSIFCVELQGLLQRLLFILTVCIMCALPVFEYIDVNAQRHVTLFTDTESAGMKIHSGVASTQ